MSDESLTRGIKAACMSVIAVCFILTIIFRANVDEWQIVALKTAAAGLSLMATFASIGAVANGKIRLLVIAGAVFYYFEFFFQISGELQNTLVEGWKDDIVIGLEHALIGTEVSLYLQKFVSPPLTELMMFAYVAYVPLLPAAALLCFLKSGTRGALEYLFALCLAYGACYMGFILFPVASQMYYNPDLYTVQLEGGLFTGLSDWIRANAHYPGGSLPSPHCAAATVIIGMLYKHARSWLYLLLPTLLLIYPSTVYGRFHYTLDVVAGIVLGLATLKFYPNVLTMIDFVGGRRAQRTRRSPWFEITNKERIRT